MGFRGQIGGKWTLTVATVKKQACRPQLGIAITLHIRQELRTRLVTYYLVVWGLKISRLGWQFQGNLVSWNQSSLLNESLTNDVMPNTPVHSITDQQGSLFSLSKKSFYTINLSPSCQTRGKLSTRKIHWNIGNMLHHFPEVISAMTNRF